MRHAAGELADRFHFLRLAQRLFGALARLVLGLEFAAARLEFARTVADRNLERLGEIAQFDQFALAVGNVDTDADDPNWVARFIIGRQPPGVNPAQLTVVSPNNAKIEFKLTLLCGKSRFDRMTQTDRVFTVNGRDPGVVTTVEFGKPVHLPCGRRQAHGAALDVPVDYADAADLFGESQKLGAFTEYGGLIRHD